MVAAGLVVIVAYYKPAPTEVVLVGDSREMGMQYGRRQWIPMKLLTRIYLDKIVCRGSPQLIKACRECALASTNSWPRPYVEELEAIAKAASVDIGALAYGNTFLDFGAIRAGCRSAVIVTNGLLLHSHNLDWDNLGGIGRWTVSIIRRNPSDQRFKTVTVTFPGMVGALDIVNEKGIALSFNQLGFGKGTVHEPVFIMMRRIAETCSTYEEACREIHKAAPGMPFIITLSDAHSGKAGVFERTRDQIEERLALQGWVAACNAVQGKQSGLTPLDQLLSKSQIREVNDLKQILSNDQVMMACNIYSLVVDFRNNCLYLASGDVPAACMPYRKYDLFK